MEPDLTGDEGKYLMEAFNSGWISSKGEYVDKFEKEFADFINADYSVAVSNGTVALHLSLITLGVKAGDEVIVPTFTFVATVASVVQTGAKPIFVDSMDETGTMCVDSIKKAISSKTKAIIPVHVYGNPSEMDEINLIAKENNIFVIEDCAEAHGAKYQEKVVGSIGDIGTFSFYANKIITTGEGGMITTNNKDMFEKIKLLRDHAMDKNRRYWHIDIGFNYRLTNLQSAIGLGQVRRIKKIITKRKTLEKKYIEFLEPFIRVNPKKSFKSSVPWQICILIDKKYNIENRDNLMKFLSSKKIDTRPFFIPIHKMNPYKRFPVFSKNNNNIPSVAEDLSSRGLILPSSTNLEDNEIEYITDSVKSFFSK